MSKCCRVRVDRLTEHINQNIGRRILSNELAEVACMSHFHFCRAFKNFVGRTPMAFVAEKRLERSIKLLEANGDDLTSIALSCGFSSQSHFNRAFKIGHGITPGQYRRALDRLTLERP